MKIYTAIVGVFIFFLCEAQPSNKSILKGKWEGHRFEIIAHYNFKNDSMYNYWTNREPDSSKVYFLKRSENDFHIIDKKHFYILATFYATEKIIFHRVK